MKHSGYEITLYRSEHMHQVVILLHQLFGGDPDINGAYFKWKYHDNPYSESPLGIVALHKGEVVGFRGYFATKWHIPQKSCQLIVLVPGDTYVCPDHRLKGLSIAMGNIAMEEFAPKYRVFLNTSAMKTSVPGYLKMGFVPISAKTYLMKYDLFKLVTKRFFEKAGEGSELSKERIECGDFADIIVAESPRSREMSAVTSRQVCGGDRIMLFQDEEFFRWRFNNGRNRYVFYYWRKDGVTTGYVVMLLLQNNQFGYIVDFAEIQTGAVQKILRHIEGKKHVDIVAIPNVSLNETFSRLFGYIGFKTNSLVERRIMRVTGACPFLVRPVQRRCLEDDWHVGGLDIRNIENWHIKGICNDGF